MSGSTWMLNNDPSVKSMEDWSKQSVCFKVNDGRWNELSETEKNQKMNDAKIHGNNGWKDSVDSIIWALSDDGHAKFTVSGMNEYGIKKACMYLANNPILIRKFEDHPNHIQTGTLHSGCAAVVNGCYEWKWEKISA